MTDEGPFGRIEVRAEKWIRNESRCRTQGYLWGLLGLSLLWFLPYCAFNWPGLPTVLGLTVAMGTIAGLVLFRAWNFSRAGLWMSESETIVRGPFGSTGRVRTSDIVGFKPVDANGHLCVGIEATSLDSELGIVALGREAFNFDGALKQMEPLCDRLNALLDELRG